MEEASRPPTGNEGGIVLVITLMFMLITAIGVAAFVHLTNTHITQVKLQAHSTQAFYAAEVALQKGIQFLKNDLYYTPKGTLPSWLDDKVYTSTGYIDLTQGGQITVPRYLNPDYPHYDNDFYPLVGEADYNFDGYGAYKATYQIDISNAQGRPDRIWVKSTGRYYRRNESGYGFTLEAERRILSLLEANEISAWDNAIFAGEGAAGNVISGNVDIRGSVHFLATTLGSTDLAANFSGDAGIGNNYAGIPSALGSRIPSIVKEHGGEMVDTLEAEVRIQHGKLALSGSAQVGGPDVPGNGVKETVDGVYITDGYSGDGAQNVYSDNGTDNPYDIDLEEFEITFPRLSEPYEGYATYLDYLRANALVISDAQQLNELDDIRPTSVFEYSDSNGRIKMDGEGYLIIEGIVVVEGPVNFAKAGSEKTIEYSGAGTIVSTSTVGINLSIITRSFSTFPKVDILGVMAGDTITFDWAQCNVMGVFYAENQIAALKQTSVAGTFLSNYFDMGLNVPAIYKVPEIVGYLPRGMIGDTRMWAIRRLTWGEIESGISQ